MSVKYCSFKCLFEKLNGINIARNEFGSNTRYQTIYEVSFKNIIKTSGYTTKENATNFKTK